MAVETLRYLKSKAEEIFASKEIETVSHQRVGALTLQMNAQANILGSLYPDIDPNTHRYIFDSPTIQATASCWLAKSEKAVSAPLQLTYIGGRQNPALDRSLEETLFRELAEEGEIYGITTANCHLITSRNYRFQHDKFPDRPKRVDYDETLYEVEIPPQSFLSPRSLDPETHAIEHIPRLSPWQLEELFTDDQIYIPAIGGHYRLIDSLSKDEMRRRRSKMQTDGREEAVRSKFIYRAILYEAAIRVQIIDSLLKISSINQKSARYVKSVKEKWDSLRPHYLEPDRFHTANDIKKFLSATDDFLTEFENGLSGEGISETDVWEVFSQTIAQNHQGLPEGFNIRKRTRLIRELSAAARYIFLKKSLEFTRQTVEQRPFLVAQIILPLGRLSASEFQLVRECSPEIKDLFGVLASTFGIMIGQNEKCYEQLEEKLKRYRELKIKVTTGNADDSEKNLYDDWQNKMITRYAKVLGISPHNLPNLFRDANEFFRYLENTLRKISGPSPIAELLQDPHYIGTSSLDELALLMFGLDQYDLDHDIRITRALVAVAWTKVMLLKPISETYKDIRKHSEHSTYAFRQVFHSMCSPKFTQEVGALTEDYSLHRYRLNIQLPERVSMLTIHLGPYPINIDLSGMPLYVFAGLRDKSFFSYLRKRLERGPDVTDYFGRMIIIDTQSLENDINSAILGHAKELLGPIFELTPFYRQLISQEIVEIARQLVVQLMIRFKSQLESMGFSYASGKEREMGRFQPENSWHGAFATAGMDPTHPGYRGSGATQPEKFSWLKYVHTIRPKGNTSGDFAQEEVQFLMSPSDARKKMEDDRNRFDIERLFISHKPGYYPLIFALFGVQQAYIKVASGRYTAIRSEG